MGLVELETGGVLPRVSIRGSGLFPGRGPWNTTVMELCLKLRSQWHQMSLTLVREDRRLIANLMMTRYPKLAKRLTNGDHSHRSQAVRVPVPLWRFVTFSELCS